MVELRTLESVREQLALGNRLLSLKRVISVDLVARTRRETVTAKVDKLLFNTLDDDELPYQEEAGAWLKKNLAAYTTITIRGKHNRVASLPYSQKDTLLDRIITIFNT